MARNTTHSQHPSNARRRRELHVMRDSIVKQRKRLRRRRAEIHRAMEIAKALVEASQRDADTYSYRALDQKSEGNGWIIVRWLEGSERHDEERFGYAASRDKARKWAREMNESPESAPGITRDEAMRQLGYRRVLGDKGAGQVTSKPVEQKFERA